MTFSKPRFPFLSPPNYTPTPKFEPQEFQHDFHPGAYRNQNEQPRRTAQQSAWNQLIGSSQIDLVAGNINQKHYRRHLLRSLLNIIGPLLLVAIYVFIIVAYLLKPIVNDIAPWRPIDGRGLFFTWTVVSVFIIDWAKSGLAALEAALLTRSSWWAPSRAKQMLWHADRTWGTLNGWVRSIRALLGYGDNKTSKRPSYLWWYLCLNSVLLYAAIPLAGLSLDRAIVYKLGDHFLVASGSNQSTFNLNPMSDGVGRRANTNWRTGQPVNGEQASILYAPEGTLNVSAFYYNDAIQTIYEQDLQDKTGINRSITFFTGPSVSERAHASTWGLKTTISCFPVNPLTGLKNMKVRSYEDWSGTPIYGTNLTTSLDALSKYNGSQYLMFRDSDVEIQTTYFLATERSYSNAQVESRYINASSFPLRGSLELVMWHTDIEQGLTNVTWPKQLKQSQYVISSVAHEEDDMEYIGYGVRCETESATGFAKLDASMRTFSDFQVAAALNISNAFNTTGIMAIEDVVFTAFSGVTINEGANLNSPPDCVVMGRGPGTGCGAWFGANQATNAGFVTIGKAHPTLGYEPIFPPRMVLALYKLFGESAVAMLAAGPREWQSSLQGLDLTNDLIAGVLPWPIPFGILVAWALGVVIPSILTFGERRFASTVGSFEMFRLLMEEESYRTGQPRSDVRVIHSRDVSPPESNIEMRKYPENESTSSLPGHSNGEPQKRVDAQFFI